MKIKEDNIYKILRKPFVSQEVLLNKTYSVSLPTISVCLLYTPNNIEMGSQVPLGRK